MNTEIIDWASLPSLWTLFRHAGATAVVMGVGARPSVKRVIIWLILIAFWIRGGGSNRLIFYWIGSDVSSLEHNRASAAYANMLRLLKVRSICGAPWFVAELRNYGINAEPVLFPYDTRPAEAFPKHLLPRPPLRVCTYLTVTGWKELQGARIVGLARRSPEVNWVVMGMAASAVPAGVDVPANIEFTGWVDAPLAVQAGTHVFLRLVAHDAFSGTVRDAMALGRIVLYSLPVFGIIDVAGKTDDELVDLLAALSLPNVAEVEQRTNSGLQLPPYPQQIINLAAALQATESRGQ